MPRFDGDQYLQDYYENGLYPEIHDDIVEMVKKHAPEYEPVCDLGSCYGLLSVRLKKALWPMTKPLVLGVEANPRYLAKAIMESGVMYLQAEINEKTMATVCREIKNAGCTLVVARRIFPEIAAGNPETVRKFSKMLGEAGVKKIILEGRIFSKRSTDALSSATAEVNALKPHFVLRDIYKNCRYMVYNGV